MKTGRTLMELAQELERQRGAKKDIVADTRHISLDQTSDNGFALAVGDDSFGITDHTHQQIGHRLNIPRRFYTMLQESHPDILQHNVNELMHRSQERRMVRTLDGTARAFLSDRYRRIDNDSVLEAALPALYDLGEGVEINSSQVTDRRLYVKASFATVEGEVAKGDIVRAGVVISNSEIGAGSVKVEQFIYRLVCTNGMIVGKSLSQHHVGSRAADSELVAVLTSETLQADDKAFMMKIRDVVKASASRDVFEKQLAAMREATEGPQLANPIKAVEVLASQKNFTVDEQNGVLKHLLTDGDLSRWGMLNAVTRTAEDVDSYDRATELERAGGELLELPQNRWAELVEAA